MREEADRDAARFAERESRFDARASVHSFEELDAVPRRIGATMSWRPQPPPRNLR
jgi:hypothetical protein